MRGLKFKKTNRQKEQTMTHHQLETIVGLPEYAFPLAENV